MTTQSNASPILKERYSEIFRFYIPSVQASFLTSADLDRFIEARFNFFQERKDEVKIDIHNPGDEFYWLINSTVVEITLPDSRFIVETLIDYCTYHEYQINMIIHPLYHVERGADGRLRTLESVEAASDAPLETQIYLEINRLEADEMESMQRDLLANFVELRTIVSDYESVDRLLSEFSSGQDAETSAVLSWLREYFVLLGAAQTDSRQIDADSPVYGVFRHEGARASISRELQQQGLSTSDASPVIFLETQTFSNVNKRKPYYLIVLRNGNRSAVIAGHFTQRAETMARTEIPYVRLQVERLLNRFRASSTSYIRKEIYRISNLIPVALFFTRPRLLEMWFDLIISNLYASEVDFSMDADPDYNMVW
ncbi:MAG: NAD-glutamate dehydrogenase, partial [Leptospiraceae bacterium]|nr:NAD-glutamate dehydrogenase [Leptospiraceae bacterium]